jgi:hypothetical protein
MLDLEMMLPLASLTGTVAEPRVRTTMKAMPDSELLFANGLKGMLYLLFLNGKRLRIILGSCTKRHTRQEVKSKQPYFFV